MSISRRYNESIAAAKRTTVEGVAPTRRRSVVAHDSAALKLGVGNNRERIQEKVISFCKKQTKIIEYRHE